MAEDGLKELIVNGSSASYEATKDATSDDATETEVPMSKLKRNIVLISLSFAEATMYMAFSLMAPFFPGLWVTASSDIAISTAHLIAAEASYKDVSATCSGFIFCVYSFVMMVMSPVFGKLGELPLGEHD